MAFIPQFFKKETYWPNQKRKQQQNSKGGWDTEGKMIKEIKKKTNELKFYYFLDALLGTLMYS